MKGYLKDEPMIISKLELIELKYRGIISFID